MAVADPAMNAVHRSLLGPKRKKRPAIREQRRVIMESVLEKGPESADRRARNIILNDQDLIEDIHARVWRCDDDETCRRWGIG
jgi:membrane glycosyltransferase